MGEKKLVCGFNKARHYGKTVICEEKPFDGSGRCIFHTPLVKKGFWGAFDKYVTDFEKKHVKQGEEASSFLDCRGFIFPATDDYFTYKKFPYQVVFNDSKFLGLANFKDIEFAKPAHFRRAEFADNVYFSDTRFLEGIDFIGCYFKGGARFYFSEFGILIDFAAAKFFNDVEFDENSFNGYVYFNNAVFEKGVLFRELEFRFGADFWKTKFFSNAIFERIGAEIKRNEKDEITNIDPAKIDFRDVFI